MYKDRGFEQAMYCMQDESITITPSSSFFAEVVVWDNSSSSSSSSSITVEYQYNEILGT